MQAAFDQPGVLERTYHGPLGAASGAKRLHLRIADLLAHGWDLARATGQPTELPEDLAQQALAFTQAQLSTVPRTGRFGPAQTVADDAPAIDQLVAFLGRHTSWIGPLTGEARGSDLVLCGRVWSCPVVHG